ncbi:MULTISPECIES: glycosyltransferase family 2 protein [unclassified Streptomyces]|uniref:glycosyltransferase family 2 protein n=1 Tax=unclassified Streptomyces TaxID=2593676 RepID=UPI0019087495|nr:MULTISPECIES: glycosyltransferase family 2 protein [unclassified Streptomyces]MCU4745809.1 glycosyltransferase family 2 protein [Streptomyces sp. G-5]QQN79231.1 glycosyltransferase family 2 protein [Streptomyces sp. XC 2026]
MKLSVVVPCYNEEAVIDRFDQQLRASLDRLGVGYELCYVDDGSADNTLTRLRALRVEHPANTRYLSFSRNFGKEAAMLAGLRAADGDAVVLMDADLQHSPELIGHMLQLHRRGHDQVVAKRDRSSDKAVRGLLSRLYYRAVNRWVDVRLTSGVGDFRLLSRAAVDALLSLPENNRFSKGLFSWIGFDTVTFDCRDAERQGGGGSKWRFGSLLNYGMDGLISFNNRPLRMAIYTGLALAALAAGYAGWVIVTALGGGVTVPGYVTLVAIIAGLGGLQMLMLGLIGEYIGRIYYETKRRPHYLVKESGEVRSPAPGPLTGAGRAPAPAPGSAPAPAVEPAPAEDLER